MPQVALPRKLWLINGKFAFRIQDLTNEDDKQVLRELISSIERGSGSCDIVYIDVVSKEEIAIERANYEWMQSPRPHGLGARVILYCSEQAQSPMATLPVSMRLLPGEDADGNDSNVLLVLHALSAICSYDTVCLTTGGKFMDVVLDYLYIQEKKVELIEFNEVMSPQLEERADTVHKVLMGSAYIFPRYRTIIEELRRIEA